VTMWTETTKIESTALAASARGLAKPSGASVPALDTHIHLFDSARPQGAHDKGPKRFSSHVSLPAGYRTSAGPLGNVGAIAVEACPALDNGPWLLSPAQAEEIMVGAADYLQPEKPEFAEYLQRYHKTPVVGEYLSCIASQNNPA
jgi:L-fuconolactonase